MPTGWWHDLGMFKHLLVATDGSSHAATAGGHAVDIARTQDARLTLVSVWQTYTSWAGLAPSAPLDEELLAQARARADKAVEAAAAQVPQTVTLEKRLLDGVPADAILRELERDDYDLVVMGSRGRGGIGSLLLGSVSMNVLHHARVPVLIVHPPEESHR